MGPHNSYSNGQTSSEKVIRIPYEGSIHYHMCFLLLLLHLVALKPQAKPLAKNRVSLDKTQWTKILIFIPLRQYTLPLWLKGLGLTLTGFEPTTYSAFLRTLILRSWVRYLYDHFFLTSNNTCCSNFTHCVTVQNLCRH